MFKQHPAQARAKVRRQQPVMAGFFMLLLLAVTLLASGCATYGTPGFDIVGESAPHNDRAFILSRNNRLSNMSLAREVQQDVRGVFANPAYVGESWFLVFEVVLHADNDDAAETRMNNFLAVEVEADGERFAVQASDSGFLSRGLILPPAPLSLRMNRAELKDANRRSGAFQFSREQFEALAHAEDLKIALISSSRMLEFSPENMSGSFQKNLQEFYLAAGGRMVPAG